jgi:hypothetical protein
MRPLAVDEVRPPAVYEGMRSEAIRRLLAEREPRRVALGDLLGVLFENRVTLTVVVEEHLRASQIEDPERIAEEVAVFNALIPGPREIGASVFLEADDAATVGRRLRELPGLSEHIHLEVDGARAERVPTDAPGLGVVDRPVELLRFRLSEQQCDAIERGGEVVVLCSHPGYRARTALDEAQRRALAEDLRR